MSTAVSLLVVCTISCLSRFARGTLARRGDFKLKLTPEKPARVSRSIRMKNCNDLGLTRNLPLNEKVMDFQGLKVTTFAPVFSTSQPTSLPSLFPHPIHISCHFPSSLTSHRSISFTTPTLQFAYLFLSQKPSNMPAVPSAQAMQQSKGQFSDLPEPHELTH